MTPTEVKQATLMNYETIDGATRGASDVQEIPETNDDSIQTSNKGKWYRFKMAKRMMEGHGWKIWKFQRKGARRPRNL
jgi:hypothetical protein